MKCHNWRAGKIIFESCQNFLRLKLQFVLGGLFALLKIPVQKFIVTLNYVFQDYDQRLYSFKSLLWKSLFWSLFLFYHFLLFLQTHPLKKPPVLYGQIINCQHGSRFLKVIKKSSIRNYKKSKKWNFFSARGFWSKSHEKFLLKYFSLGRNF